VSVRIGIDLGGTKIEAIALDGGREVARRRMPTPRGDYDATLAAIAGLVESLEQHLSCSGSVAALGTHVRSNPLAVPVGVGIPGTISTTTGLVKNANSTWLNGRPLLRDLEVKLARQVRVANDANCFAVSEATDGAGAGIPVVFGVIIGTGVGGGIAIGGHPLAGANGIAGEWGHNPLPWAETDELPGPECYCGKRGCIETFLSGSGLSADHHRWTGASMEPADIVAAARNGDAAADATLRRYELRMARALASVINVLDPDVIVLGGGLSNIDRFYTAVPPLWEKFVFAAVGDGTGHHVGACTRLVRAQHGDSSGVRGAAWL
jgi:fructokinase